MSSSSTPETVNGYQDPEEEWVLLMPPRLAQSSFSTLVDSNCVFRAWHLEGRFGSRTHKDPATEKIGIPVLSKAVVERQAKIHDGLRNLLRQEGVEVVWKKFTPSNRAIRDPPSLDARIHPERAPATIDTATRPSNTHFTYIDLFAGMGGFAVALDRLGGKCVLASEIDEACQRIYKHNFPEAPLKGDIYQIKETDLPSESVDLLVGGFPCQPFSALGEQPGIECPKAGGLFLEIVRLLKACQPKAFLLENVPGLLAMKDTFKTILKSLEDAGYQVHYEICNARGLTVTSRKRLFLAGFLQDKQELFRFPYVPDLQLRTHDVIDYSNQELTEMEQVELPITDEQLEALQKGKKWRPAHLAWPNTVCSTLVSHYGNSIARGHSQLVPCSAATASATDNTNPRRFSPRECLRIMGFPNSYQLPPKSSDIQGDKAFLKEQYRMAGNAVCPPLIAAIAGAVIGHARGETSDWVDYSRKVAIELAYQAARTEQPQPTTTSNRKRKADAAGDE